MARVRWVGLPSPSIGARRLDGLAVAMTDVRRRWIGFHACGDLFKLQFGKRRFRRDGFFCVFHLSLLLCEKLNAHLNLESLQD